MTQPFDPAPLPAPLPGAGYPRTGQDPGQPPGRDAEGPPGDAGAGPPGAAGGSRGGVGEGPPGGAPGEPCAGASDPPLRVGTAGLVAALPVLLGFRPRESLVLVGTGGPAGKRVGLTVRVDLPAAEDPDLAVAVAESAAEALTRDDPVGAAVVVVGGAARAQPEPWPPRPEVAGAAASALLERGITPHTVVWTAGIEPGAPWACYPVRECGCSGVLPDPSGTELAATAALRGTVVYGSREELEEQVRPVAPAASAGAPSRLSGGRGSTSDPRRALDRALGEAARGRLVVDASLVRTLSAGLRLPWFRDEALATCVGPRAAAAEQLWAALARTAPGPAAADPAALLAVCALVRGDGALANVALERALAARPAHRLATGLGEAIDAGWSPPEFRTWLEGSL